MGPLFVPTVTHETTLLLFGAIVNGIIPTWPELGTFQINSGVIKGNQTPDCKSRIVVSGKLIKRGDIKGKALKPNIIPVAVLEMGFSVNYAKQWTSQTQLFFIQVFITF